MSHSAVTAVTWHAMSRNRVDILVPPFAGQVDITIKSAHQDAIVVELYYFSGDRSAGRAWVIMTHDPEPEEGLSPDSEAWVETRQRIDQLLFWTATESDRLLA
jgi:hypothetical protein